MDPVMAALDSVAARKERLQKAFTELENERSILSRFTLQWKELDELFAEAERNVRKRHEDLVSKERAFEAKAKEMQEALDKRDQAVYQMEQRLLARLNEQKESAVVAITEEKINWSEGHENMDADAATAAAAVATAASADESKQEEVALSNSSLSQSMDLDLNLPQPTEALESPGHDDEFVENVPSSCPDADTRKPISATEVSVRPELKALCENMDGDGLRRYIVDHRKEVPAFRHELPCALQCAIDPARLVLGALEAYHPEPAGHMRKETEASATRRACILLLECLQIVLADPVLGVDHPVVPPNIKEVAKELAEKWRSRMDIQKDAAAGSSLDAQAFLQLLATFGIASQYNEEELCKLVSAVARRKQTPALCRALGLSAKIPDIVDKLIEEGKQIEALSFANEFGIMDRIQPVPLLKNYLKEARKTAQTMLKSGHSSAAAQNDSMMKELSALRSVLKCIEDYNLESDYPSSPLQKRILHLEKAKSDRKRTGGSVKGQSKRPRGSHNGGYPYRNSDRSSERNHYGGGGSAGYPFVSPVAFERQTQGGYLASYAPGSRNTVSISNLPPNSYLYSAAADGSIYGAAGYTTPSSSYGSYATLRNALPPPPPAYQASFMH